MGRQLPTQHCCLMSTLSDGTSHPYLLPHRLAIEAGAPIVPVFAFGQTPHLRFWRPFIDWPAFLFSRTAMSRWVLRFVVCQQPSAACFSGRQ